MPGEHSDMGAKGLAALLAAALILAACSGGDDTPLSVQAEYCEEAGGTVETRNPYWDTNQDQSGWVQLPGMSTEVQRGSVITLSKRSITVSERDQVRSPLAI